MISKQWLVAVAIRLVRLREKDDVGRSMDMAFNPGGRECIMSIGWSHSPL